MDLIYIAKKKTGKTYHKTIESAQAKFSKEDGWNLQGGTCDGISREEIYIRRGEYGVVKTTVLED